MKPPRSHRLSDYQIRKEGWEALTERLGVSGAIRFLMQYDSGRGDYTRERAEILAGLSFEDALAGIRAASRSGRGARKKKRHR
ncbi:MAG: hypothetical protein HY720_02920 [Planctomycetes bacterium]|nr:hypothetical protein [Planctomycetota bacterium]